MPYLQLDTINSVTTLSWLHTFETAHRIKILERNTYGPDYSNTLIFEFFLEQGKTLYNAPTH